MWLRKICLWPILLSLSTLTLCAEQFAAPAPLTPEQTALIQKSVVREKAAIQEIKKRTPLVQTYIQNMRPDPKLYAVPVSDQYMLSRVDFGKAFTAVAYKSKSNGVGFFKGSSDAVRLLTKLFRMSYSPTGFMDMMFVDPRSYDLQHYDFSFVRREFLGNVRTAVFDIHPKAGTGAGHFVGRIWIEDQDGNIVRFNGSYTTSPFWQTGQYLVHFDSWRSNIAPNVWLPMAIFAEDDRHPNKSEPGGFRAQTFFWGYSLKLPTHVSDSETVQIDNVTDESNSAQDVSPLEAQRDWDAQAEENVLDRLVTAGLLAPPSPFDKVLEQVTNNIILGNKLILPGDIHCRVLLTTPLESLSVGNTILISKGLVDVLPSEEDLAAVLSFQLAHIALGHEIDTRYAFDDRLLFPDEVAFRQLKMSHSEQDDAAAARKAVQLLEHSVYRDKLADVALLFDQIEAREKDLKALLTPRVGDSVLKPDGTPWLSALCEGPSRLDMNNLSQIAALPLGSHLKVDPWSDTVYALNVKPAPILNPSDKMPLEITPIYFRLSRYQASSNAAPASPTPTSGDQPQGSPGQ